MIRNNRSEQSLVLISILLLSGCFGMPGRVASPEIAPTVAVLRVDLDQTRDVKKALYKQLREWRSVPNRLGGLSKQGVDCSGLVYLTYRSHFGMQLPRSTRQQARAGVEINQDELRPGDLVFFRTGFVQRHVGMYTGEGKFIHASTSRGVMESHMNNPYWTRNYWKSVRVRL